MAIFERGLAAKVFLSHKQYKDSLNQSYLFGDFLWVATCHPCLIKTERFLVKPNIITSLFAAQVEASEPVPRTEPQRAH